MKTFKRYLSEMPLLFDKIWHPMRDNEVEQRVANETARRRGKKVGSVNGVDFYLVRAFPGLSPDSAGAKHFVGVQGDNKVAFTVHFDISRKPMRFGPAAGLKVYTQSYIELIDGSLSRDLLMYVPTKFLTKNNYAIFSDGEQSNAGRNMWIRMMRKFSSEGHVIGWHDRYEETWDCKMPHEPFDEWLSANNKWGSSYRDENVRYFILPKSVVFLKKAA